MKEREIFEQALGNLHQLTDINVINQVFYPMDKGYDGEFDLEFGNTKAHFLFDIKKELRNDKMARLPLNGKDAYPLLICQYIPKPVKEKLKAERINYLEATGNCFIRTNQLYFHINDQPVTPVRLPAEGKLWKVAGLRFLFIFLLNPDILNQPYRKIADAAGIALGNIGPLIGELEKEGYVKRQKNTWVLDGRMRLMDRWANAYGNTLRPKLLLGTYKFADKLKLADWRQIDANNFEWGAEPAGALLTGYLDPERLALYTGHEKNDIIRTLRLVPAANGPVEILTKFWPNELNVITDQPIVPPLLAYAELLNNFDSRNQETADRIRKQYLYEPA